MYDHVSSKGGSNHVKMYVRFLFIFLFGLFLIACSVDKEAVTRYKQEKPLEIDISVPQPFLPHKPQVLKAVLRQDGKAVADAKDVHFIIWKKNSSSQTETIDAKNAGNGVYTMEKILDQDGVYYVKVNASAHGSRIMPTKQFIVGNMSEQIDPVKTQDTEQHHQHH